MTSSRFFLTLRHGLVPGLLLLAGCRRPAHVPAAATPVVEADTVIYAPDAPQRASLVTAPVQPQTGVQLSFTGRVVWDEDATVRVFSPVFGRVSSVTGALGDEVAPGALLARLASPDLDQALAEARKAESALALADRTLTRLRDLFAHGAIARKDLEGAEDALVGAQAERQRTLAKLRLYGADSASTAETYPLRSPIGGTIVERNLNPGQELRPDAQMANLPQFTAGLFVITNPRRLWVLLDASELDVATLRPDQPLRLTSRAYPGRVFSGRITSIGASLDPSTRTLKVRGYVENPDLLLKAEMYVDATAENAAAGGGVSIAAPALFLIDNQPCVYVETAPGRYRRRAVTVGAEAGGRVLVSAGLAPTDRVVVEGALLLETVRTGGS